MLYTLVSVAKLLETFLSLLSLDSPLQLTIMIGNSSLEFLDRIVSHFIVVHWRDISVPNYFLYVVVLTCIIC
jgi:hypothetical protein